MKSSNIMNSIAKTFNKVSFNVKKNSPEICLALGLASVGAGIVWACIESTKAPAVIDITKNDIQKIVDTNVPEDTIEITEADVRNIITSQPEVKKELIKVYANAGKNLGKLYFGPAVVIIGGGALILASHGVMSKRNASLSAAYGCLNTTFEQYRKRVAEKIGAEAEENLRYGITSKTVKEKVIDENGEVRTEKTKIDVVEQEQPSDYVRYFTPQNLNWEDESDYNEMFLNRRQRYANDLLRTRGYLYLNTVYEMLGVKQSKAGQRVGWRYKENNESGDNLVQFKVKKVQIPVSSDPEDGYQKAYMIDFNVDGDIFATLPEEEYFEM